MASTGFTERVCVYEDVNADSLQACFVFLLSTSLFFSLLSKPFPIGDRVTFSGKDCMCQQCSHTLVKSNEPIKIHGPSRKFGACLTPSISFKATRRVCQEPFVGPSEEVHLVNQVPVRSVVWPVRLIFQIGAVTTQTDICSVSQWKHQENNCFWFVFHIYIWQKKDLCVIYCVSIAYTGLIKGVATSEPTEVYGEPVVSCGQ